MYDVIIIGAGASGLFAAVLLSQTGKKVLVLEKNTREGKKLSLCGGGKCNVGPIERESAELSLRYSQFSLHAKTAHFRKEEVRSLKNLYYTYPPALIEKLWTSTALVCPPFQGLGIKLTEDAEGRLYPAEFDARSLATELRKKAQKNGAEFRFNSEVTALEQEHHNNFIITSKQDDQTTVLSARFVILASGGFSYPSIGGSDFGNTLLEKLGIAHRSGKSAMGPLMIKDYPFTASSGTVIPAKITVRSRITGAELVHTGIDQLLFTHRGLSGPVILDICAAVHECESEEPSLLLDLIPAQNKDELLAGMLRTAKEHPKKHAVQFLSSFLPRVLSETILSKAEINSETPSIDVTKASLLRLCALVKEFPLEPKLPTSKHEAMSWSGGCDPSELDFTTMEVKKKPGLFITGDMVALCRPCGGYSLWFCWTSALAASIKIDSL